MQPPASATPLYRAAARTGSTRRYSARGEGRAGAWTAAGRSSRGRGGEGSLRPVVGVLSKPPPLFSHQVTLLYRSLQTDLSRTHSFHWPPGVAEFNRMEAHLSLLISNIFLVPCQTWLLPQGAQRIVGEERIKGTGATREVCADSSRSTGQQGVNSICACMAGRHPGGLHGRGDAC